MASVIENGGFYVHDTNPNETVNPKQVGAHWTNYKSGKIYVCSDNTRNKNKWTILNPDIVIPQEAFGTGYIYITKGINNREYNRWYNLSDVIKNNLQFSIGNYYRYNYKKPMFLFFSTYNSWEEAGGCGVIIDGVEYRYSGAGYGDCVYAIVKAGSWFSYRMYNYYLGSLTTLFLPSSNDI